MKYYSEILDKMFNSKNDLIDAEHTYRQKKKKDSRTQADITYDNYLEANKKADELLKKADEEVKPLYHQICEIYDKANNEIDKIVSEAKERFEEEKKKYAETIIYDDELVGLLKLFKWL